MSPSLPEQVDASVGGDQPVLEWQVPLVIDGAPAVVDGSLVWVAPRGPLLPALVGLVAAALAVAVVRRRPASVPGLVAVVAATMGLVGLLQVLGQPPGAGGPILPALLPAIALLGAFTALVLQPRRATQSRAIGLLATVPVIVAVAVQWGSLTSSQVPVPLPATLVSGLLAASLAASLGALARGIPSLIVPLDALGDGAR